MGVNALRPLWHVLAACSLGYLVNIDRDRNTSNTAAEFESLKTVNKSRGAVETLLCPTQLYTTNSPTPHMTCMLYTRADKTFVQCEHLQEKKEVLEAMRSS